MFSDHRSCISDRIRKAILERICDGTYPSGHRLIELQLAKEFETSQAPVREALSELEAMRILETEPYKGTRVRSIKYQELQECLRIRGALENLAAEEVGTALMNRIPELREKADRALEAARLGDLQLYKSANVDFHRMIVEASGNQMLMMVWDMLVPEVRMTSTVRSVRESLITSANEHMEIVDAFAQGDNRYAGKLLRIHTESVLLRMSENNNFGEPAKKTEESYTSKS